MSESLTPRVVENDVKKYESEKSAQEGMAVAFELFESAAGKHFNEATVIERLGTLEQMLQAINNAPEDFRSNVREAVSALMFMTEADFESMRRGELVASVYPSLVRH